jgi:hypothetical protein
MTPCGCSGSTQPAALPDGAIPGPYVGGGGDYYWNGPAAVDTAEVSAQPPQPTTKPA